MSAGRPPFAGWPGWRHLQRTALLGLLVAGWFALVYVGADWITEQHAIRVRVHFAAELNLPFLPAFTLAYVSLYAAFAAVPFILRSRCEVRRLARDLALAIGVAGVCFVALPARLAYPPPPADLGLWTPLFRFADWANLDHNLLPSLHVTLGVLCLESFARQAAAPGRMVLSGWAGLIAASTMLIHQHHLLDVIVGGLLAWGIRARHWSAGGARADIEPTGG